MNNKVFSVNLSGIRGVLLLIVLIALGFLALTFFAVFIAVIAVLGIAGFIIRRILRSVGLKKEEKPVEEEVKQEYFRGRMIENADFKVEDDDEKQ